MKVIQVPFCFYPDPVGGTEIYVESLSTVLKKKGIEVIVAAPGDKDISYAHNGISVRRFAVNPDLRDIRDLYGEGDPLAAQRFGSILNGERPDVVHLHAFTRGVSLLLVLEAKRRGIPVILTYHTPTVSCQRGTLMRWGKEVCDGRLDLGLCTRCTLQGLGLPRVVANVVGRVPPFVGNILEKCRLSGGPWTALRMRELVNLRHHTFYKFMSEVDHIVVVCRWAQEVLAVNRVPPEKITLSRHGLEQVNLNLGKQKNGQSGLRLAFFGRMEPAKGAHVLIRAIRMASSLPLTLDLYCIAQERFGALYLKKLKEQAAGDSRIDFLGPVPSADVATHLRRYDLLVVPSQWLETGPMIILEAFAQGVPVLGSNLGGISEWVEHGVNGLLVEPTSPEAWCDELRRLCDDEGLLVKLRAGIRPPRRMEEVAGEMEALYLRCTSLKSGA